jgi:hypothetical protein
MSPALDLSFLTERLGLTPDQESLVGVTPTEISGGKRKASVSLWSTRLNEKEWLDSEEIDFSGFLRGCLPSLTPHRELFASLSEEASVYLDVVARSDTLHLVVRLDPDIHELLASILVEMFLQFYGTSVPDPGE